MTDPRPMNEADERRLAKDVAKLTDALAANTSLDAETSDALKTFITTASDRDAEHDAAIAEHTTSLNALNTTILMVQSELRTHTSYLEGRVDRVEGSNDAHFAVCRTNDYLPSDVAIAYMVGWKPVSETDPTFSPENTLAEAAAWGIGADWKDTLLFDLEPNNQKAAELRFADMDATFPQAQPICIGGNAWPRGIPAAIHWRWHPDRKHGWPVWGNKATKDITDQAMPPNSPPNCRVVMVWHRMVEAPFTMAPLADLRDMLIYCFHHGITPVFINHTPLWVSAGNQVPRNEYSVVTDEIFARAEANHLDDEEEMAREDQWFIGLMRHVYENGEFGEPYPEFQPIIGGGTVDPDPQPPPPLETNFPKVGSEYQVSGGTHGELRVVDEIQPKGVKVEAGANVARIVIKNSVLAPNPSIDDNGYGIYNDSNVGSWNIESLELRCFHGNNPYCMRGGFSNFRADDLTLENNSGKMLIRISKDTDGFEVDDFYFEGGRSFIGSGPKEEDKDYCRVTNMKLSNGEWHRGNDNHIMALGPRVGETTSKVLDDGSVELIQIPGLTVENVTFHLKGGRLAHCENGFRNCTFRNVLIVDGENSLTARPMKPTDLFVMMNQNVSIANQPMTSQYAADHNIVVEP